jgi:hypothetical protein
MGHADIKTTMVYTHYAPGANEANLVNDVFGAPGPRDPGAATTDAGAVPPPPAKTARRRTR